MQFCFRFGLQASRQARQPPSLLPRSMASSHPTACEPGRGLERAGLSATIPPIERRFVTAQERGVVASERGVKAYGMHVPPVPSLSRTDRHARRRVMSLRPCCCAVVNLVFPGGTQFLQPWHIHFGNVEAWVHGRNTPMPDEWEKRGRSRQARHAIERRDPHAGQRLAEGVHLGWTQLKLGNMVRGPF
ncbi:hypothetical protein LX32DRAFT_305117 [Colletotrichum zoysiae]|uniref:Uncharacterized protein n=1 Tax=Colletotrichum zoysiae TaxID=1216348 RepID=A0AAD9H3G4_9PEZI|nr:hypothetical protein LX32DRAFT_305117 [Colletotrichum zoysiae]